MHRPCARALHRFLRENWQLLLTLFPHCSTHRTEWPLVLIRCSLPPGAFRYPFSHLLGAWWQQLFQLSPLQQAATPCLFLSSVTAPTGAAWWSVVVSRGLVWWQYLLILDGRLGLGRMRASCQVGLADDHSCDGRGIQGKRWVIQKDETKCCRGVVAESWTEYNQEMVVAKENDEQSCF